MVGMNLCRFLIEQGEHELLTPSRDELDLLNQEVVKNYIHQQQPDLIIHLAAVVGGIQANINSPVKFLVENTLINTHVIQSALLAGTPKFLNMGSSCMYPKDRERLHEEDLLTGKLEPTNEGYALAKNSSALLCRYISQQYGLAYKTIIPTNLYGPYDNFDLVSSHLMPAIIRKIHEAKQQSKNEVIIWGDGEARREFMYVDDLARFIILAMELMSELPDIINVGCGEDHTINEYYEKVAKVFGYQGGFVHDLSKPVGMRCKLLDVTRAKNLGWRSVVSLEEGIEKTYQFFLTTVSNCKVK